MAPAALGDTPQPKPPPLVVIGAAVALGVVLVAVASAVLWHTVLTPKPQKTERILSGFVQGAKSADPIDLALNTGGDFQIKTDTVTIDRVWMDACQKPGPGKTPADQCDRQPFFERTLIKAILENGGCAPERPKQESISYALEVNYRLKKRRLFVGRSGSLRASDAKAAVECVERALPEPDWDNLPHEHTRYIVGVLATYLGEKRQ